MRTSLLVLALLALPLRADDEEKAKKRAEQTAAVEAAWKALDLGTMAVHEGDGVRVVATEDMKGKLKAVATTVGKYRERAISVLKLDPKDPYPGKVTVYLLPSAANFPSFARLVEKRRPVTGETASFAADDATLHVAVAPPRAGGMLVDVKAGELVASLLLMRRAGVKTPVPDWLSHGFGRATTYRLSPKDKAVLAEKKLIQKVSRRKGAADVWDGKLEEEEYEPMNGALAEFFAYGPGAAKFQKFLAAYRPSEEVPSPTTAQALDAIGSSAATVEKTFRMWAAK